MQSTYHLPLRPEWVCPHWVRFSVYNEQFVYLKWLVLFVSETWQRESKISVFRTLCAPCGCIKKLFLCLMKRIIAKIGKAQPCYSIWINAPQLCASLTIMSGSWQSGTLTHVNDSLASWVCWTRLWHYSHCRTLLNYLALPDENAE